MRRFREGDLATVIYTDQMPFILNYQREVTIARVDGDDLYVKTGNTYPPDLELGPIPASQLTFGWPRR